MVTKALKEKINEIKLVVTDIDGVWTDGKFYYTDEGYFLNINRYFSAANNYNFYFHKFPYDNKWNIIKSETSWLQKNIHFFLTKRDNYENKDINEFKHKLKEFTMVRNKFRKSVYYKLKTFLKKIIVNK